MMINGFAFCVAFFRPTLVDSSFSSPAAPVSPGIITVPPNAFGANARIGSCLGVSLGHAFALLDLLRTVVV
jgi:hypothetical protein